MNSVVFKIGFVKDKENKKKKGITVAETTKITAPRLCRCTTNTGSGYKQDFASHKVRGFDQE